MIKACFIASVVLLLPIAAGLNNKAKVEREAAARRARLTSVQPIRPIPIRLSKPTYEELEDQVYRLENRLARYE